MQVGIPLLPDLLADLVRSKPGLVAENALLRQQLIVLRRTVRDDFGHRSLGVSLGFDPFEKRCLTASLRLQAGQCSLHLLLGGYQLVWPGVGDGGRASS